MGVVASNHPLAQQATIDWADLTTTPLLVRETGSGSREILVNLAQAANVALTEFHQLITVNNPAAIRQLLLRGAGVSFVYRSVVAEDLAAGRLKVLPLTASQLRHDLDLVYQLESPYAQLYQDWAAWLK